MLLVLNIVATADGAATWWNILATLYLIVFNVFRVSFFDAFKCSSSILPCVCLSYNVCYASSVGEDKSTESFCTENPWIVWATCASAATMHGYPWCFPLQLRDFQYLHRINLTLSFARGCILHGSGKNIRDSYIFVWRPEQFSFTVFSLCISDVVGLRVFCSEINVIIFIFW